MSKIIWQEAASPSFYLSRRQMDLSDLDFNGYLDQSVSPQTTSPSNQSNFCVFKKNGPLW